MMQHHVLRSSLSSSTRQAQLVWPTSTQGKGAAQSRTACVVVRASLCAASPYSAICCPSTVTSVQQHKRGPRATSSWSLAPCAGSAQRRLQLHCNAAAAKKTEQLPIFPLNVVALPYSTVPLVVFEARYRVLFNTLLAGSDGVEDGLVVPDSPFRGTKRFGMCWVDNSGSMAAVGTALEIQDHAHIEDGRIFVTSKGKERFRILRIVKEKPILICEVESVDEEAEDSTDATKLKALASDVAGLLRSTIQLNVKMNNIVVTDDQMEPEELAELAPGPLSYWVASFFGDVRPLQQSLLEMSSVEKRLEKEKTILDDTVKYYSAAAALRGAFSTTTTEGEDGPINLPKVDKSSSSSSSSSSTTAADAKSSSSGSGSSESGGSSSTSAAGSAADATAGSSSSSGAPASEDNSIDAAKSELGATASTSSSNSGNQETDVKATDASVKGSTGAGASDDKSGSDDDSGKAEIKADDDKLA